MTRHPSQEAPAAAPFDVGRWHADPATDTLTLDGREVKLEPRTMRLLVALAEHPGAVCGSEALLDTVWAGFVVTGHSLYQAIGELRSALKADTGTPEFVVNVPRKGYRLVAPVTRRERPAAAPVAAATALRVSRSPLRTIAVLPFRDLGLPAETRFLRDLLLGDLVAELSRQPALSTIAHGTMLMYGDRSVSPRRVAEELGAAYVVDGSIVHLGDRLSIACELIDVVSDTALASESIEVPATRWPEIGQRVVGRLARALRLEVSEHAWRGVHDPASGRSAALELTMRAWVDLYCRPQTKETNDRAWGWAREALQEDDSLGATWNVIAYCEWRAAQYAWEKRPWAELLADAVAHGERATLLAPGDPDAHYTLGLATYTSRQLERAESTLRHCLSISASYAPAYGTLALVRAVRGHPEEAGDLCQRAFALSPREPLRATWHYTLACASSMLGRDEEALEHATSGVVANAAFPSCHLIAAVSSKRLGRDDTAARHVAALRQSAFASVEQVRRRLPPMSVEPWASAFLADLHAAGLPQR